MEKVKFEVEASKAAKVIADAILKVVSEAKKAGEDGFQAGKDIPQVMLSSLGDLSSAWAQFGKLGDDAKEDVAAVLNGFALVPGQLVGVALEVKKEKKGK